MSIDKDTASKLSAALEKVFEYAKASDDIPSWEAEEIGSLLIDAQFIINDNTAAAQTDRDKAVIDLAREQLPLREGIVEIDADAVVSDGDENGAYVQIWGWVDFADTALDKDPRPEACLKEIDPESAEPFHCHREAGHDGPCSDWAPNECPIEGCACNEEDDLDDLYTKLETAGEIGPKIAN